MADINKKIKISAIICTYNREPLLVCALDSILSQSFPSDQFEVLVVDNNSNDGTPETVRQKAETAKPAVRYLFEERQGKSYALNRAIREAKGEYLAFTDDDVRLAPDWLERILQRFEMYRPDLIGGRVVPDWNGQWPDWFHPEYRGVVAYYYPYTEPIFLELDRHTLPCGANMAARADVFRKYGMFREDLSDGTLHRSEDYELFRRILKDGGRVLYAPDIVVYHIVQPDRLTRRYVRQWWMTQGMANSRMRLDEDPGVPKILGVPRWMYRRALDDLVRMVARFVINPRCREAFYHETRLWRFYGFVKDRWTRGKRA
ncbi:MAG: glycosyltransferase family 2 protein [Nitrospirae bacterium]|nr:glycosyltransferase family 2 protein [Nitrospirota bacterium]